MVFRYGDFVFGFFRLWGCYGYYEWENCGWYYFGVSWEVWCDFYVVEYVVFWGYDVLLVVFGYGDGVLFVVGLVLSK